MSDANAASEAARQLGRGQCVEWSDLVSTCLPEGRRTLLFSLIIISDVVVHAHTHTFSRPFVSLSLSLLSV